MILIVVFWALHSFKYSSIMDYIIEEKLSRQIFLLERMTGDIKEGIDALAREMALSVDEKLDVIEKEENVKKP